MNGWNYAQFDPLKTAEEYQQSYNKATGDRNAYMGALNSINQQFQNPSSYLPSREQLSAFVNGDQSQSWSLTPRGFNEFEQRYGVEWGKNPDGTVNFLGGANPPPVPNQDAYNQNIQQLQQNQTMRNDAYASQMGGGWAGGVLPANMAQTFASGGQFAANPTSGVRPTNPFATPEAASYGSGSAQSATYGGAQGGLGGLGGVDPFSIQNPYA